MENFLEVQGFCPICESEVLFTSRYEWLRDHFLCPKCRSIPRERALMVCIQKHVPDWREKEIFESSPSNRGVSTRLNSEARGYCPSHYFPYAKLGSILNGYRNENLESLTFQDQTFDLVITQDVMEHVFHPDKAVREISRILVPGGLHIFTVPIVRKSAPSRRRARFLPNGDIEHIEEPQYHGNPIDSKGSLVTFDYGYDFIPSIYQSSSMVTIIEVYDDLSRGLRAEFIEVCVSYKITASSAFY